MSDRIAGVDIGAAGVRVAVVKGVDREGYIKIERFGAAALPPESFEAGKIRHPKAVATALLGALRSAKVPVRGVTTVPIVVGFSAPEVAIRQVQLPPGVKRLERDAALRNTRVAISPSLTRPDEVLLSASLVGTADSGAQVLSVAAAPRASVSDLLSVCETAGVSPRAIDLSAAGLVRALVRDEAASTVVRTIVDIGAASTLVVTTQGVLIRSVRCLEVGGDRITTAIASTTQEPREEAEQRKFAASLLAVGAPLYEPAPPQAGYGTADLGPTRQEAPRDATRIEAALHREVDLMVSQIALAIEQDGSDHGSPSTTISLCGGTSLLQGLKDRLARRLNTQVRIGHPWAQLVKNRSNAKYLRADGSEDPSVMLALSCAAGLGLWRQER